MVNSVSYLQAAVRCTFSAWSKETAAFSCRAKALEMDNCEPKRADEILNTASAFFAQTEFDR